MATKDKQGGYDGDMLERAATDNDLKAPLYEVLGTIAALWAIANVGYYIIFPTIGFSIDYNKAPVAIAFYFFIWAVVSIIYFWRLFRSWLIVDSRIWLYGALSFGFAGLIWVLLLMFSMFPTLQGPQLSPYTDILLSTQWYFLPKAVEVWVQQILIVILILELHYRFRTFNKVLVGYGVCFGGAHLLMFSLSGAPTPYAVIMTTAAMISTFIFPHLILRVRGGFVYAYAIHLLFYIFLAILLHTWPPPGYGV